MLVPIERNLLTECTCDWNVELWHDVLAECLIKYVSDHEFNIITCGGTHLVVHNLVHFCKLLGFFLTYRS